MNNQECCNHNCNQGRDCPLRKETLDTRSYLMGRYDTSPVKELTDEEIIESLAELEHQQWMKWADAIMQTEKISDVRFARWASCMIPYAELSEEMKEHDRVWARQALAILRKAQEK